MIRRRKPDVVLGLGGFASFPGALMGVATRPSAGRARLERGRGAREPRARARRRPHPAGLPRRDARQAREARRVDRQPVARRDRRGCRRRAERFAGRTGPLRLLVVGGSLGAQALNERVPAALARLPREARPLVVHQAGAKHIDALRAAYRDAGVEAECVAFIDDMAARYAWADFAIARGGALTVSELAAVGLGALIVPLPGAIADEQTANARFLVEGRRRDPHRAGRARRPSALAGAPRGARPAGGARDGARRARRRPRRRGRPRRRRLPRARGSARMKGKVHARALRRHRRRRHERHRRGARDAGLRGVGLRPRRERRDAAGSRRSASARCVGHDASHVARRRRRRRLERRARTTTPRSSPRASSGSRSCRAR